MNQRAPLLLLIDDDDQARRLVRVILKARDFRLREATTAADGLDAARACRPDVVLSELSLPDERGARVVEQLRARTLAPILVVSQCERERDKVAAFEAGADDYVTKPFGGDELVARVRALLRRAAGTSSERAPVVCVRELRLDLERRLVSLRGADLHLTPTEYKLLAALMRRAGAVISTKELLDDVWGPEFVDRRDYLRVYVSQLRQKIERDPARPEYLVTEPAVGYRIRVES